MKVLELFSGIGGMRCGLAEALDGSEELSVVSVDLNEFCNKIYSESFGSQPHAMDICAITPEWCDAVRADVWTMSPPCQPYSRQGNMLGSQDDRAKPLHHLIGVMGQISVLPRMILVENVKNFETSDSFEDLRAVLESRGFELHGYLLNPLYMGFPNSRLRFFLVAVLRPDVERIPFKISTNDPHMSEYEFLDTRSRDPRRIAEFLCKPHHEVTAEKLLVPERVLVKRAAMCFDVVAPRSFQCLCFTRSYRKFINGTGSVLLDGLEDDVTHWDDMKRPQFEIESMESLAGRLRYFCPLEAARLNGFTVNDGEAKWSLRFTEGCAGSIHYYRAVGNSLNPHVVAFLVRRHS